MSSPLPTASLVPRDVTLLSADADKARLRYCLPALSTSPGSPPVDVRVLIRPARLFREYRSVHVGLSQKLSALNMKHNMDQGKRMLARAQKNTGNSADAAREDHEFFMEHLSRTREVDAEIDANARAYASKARALLPPPPGLYDASNATGDAPTSDWFAVTPEGFYAPLASGEYDEPKPVLVSGSRETDVVSLANLGPNTFFEVQVQARRRADGDANAGWSPASAPVSFSTLAAPWQIQLESAGLHALIDVFAQNGLGDMGTWLELLSSPQRMLDVGVDPVAESQLRAILSREGIVTPEERARLDEDRVELGKLVDVLVSNQRQAQADESKLYLGDPVAEKKRGGKALGVVVEARDDAADVRWMERGQDPTAAPVARGVPRKDLTRVKFDFFLSHAQLEAQNQVAHLSMLLRDAGTSAWLDMDSERLEAQDMVRGIANSTTFLLYLTKGYFTRYFCRLECSVAIATKRPIVIVYESDERHGGDANYVALVDAATKKYPEYREALLKTEAIPMARRAYQRRAVVEEILKRANVTGRAATGSAPASRGSIFSRGVGAGAGADANEELRRLIADLRAEVNELKDENTALWSAIRGGAKRE